MSTRWYPIYQKGGPQLRVFLPNFWLKLVRTEQKQPQNVVQFQCSMEMTKHDIRNYLEKIYNVTVVDVRTRIALGKTRQVDKGYVVKDDDIKYAYVALPKEEKFEFPDLFPKEKETKEADEKTLDEVKKGHKKFLEKNKDRHNIPGWFSI
ncbi:probable 39S ribosomal protein L23, mitochondrial [Agrilus planipennis]|uniref:Large ribosomal subunit protein uL23m n=1 Tax=Agrilus planipennis TaxID=224129 RepID=A0A1W4XL58_AGRPL|nr:probable 39S ribosomal protein L23, mitochondrial [Agrilus planipennis]